jgi:large subunit ribosomal protein L10
MNRVEKSAAIEQYKALFDGIESMVLVDTSGVSVNSINEVRSKFRAEGVTFVVIKNTLAAHALQGTELEPVTALFKGPIAIALKKDDPVTPAKIAAAFAKDNPKFEIRGGFAFGKVLDIKGVDDLSKTKGKKRTPRRSSLPLQSFSDPLRCCHQSLRRETRRSSVRLIFSARLLVLPFFNLIQFFTSPIRDFMEIYTHGRYERRSYRLP